MGLKANYTRRELLRCLALGGAVVGGVLWIPGARLISIPREPEIALGRLTLDFDTQLENLKHGRDYYEGLQWEWISMAQMEARYPERLELNRIMANTLPA